MKLIPRFKLAVAIATCVLPAATAQADQFFPAGFWSQPLAAAADAAPGPVISDLAARAAKTASFSLRQWDSRIYRVGADQPGVHVVVDGTSNAVKVLQAALDQGGGVPIPDNALPSSLPLTTPPDTDAALVVYQPDWTDGSGNGTGRVWEFWRASTPAQNAPGAPPLPWGEASHGDSQWHVKWGGRISYTSRSNGYPVDRNVSAPTVADRIARAATDPSFESSGWLATATSLPLLGGMVTFDDWANGVIDHTVGLVVPKSSIKPTTFSWPAQRTDGKALLGLMTEGTRLRLPSGYPIDPTAPRLIQMLEQAAKTYGFVVWDGGGGVSFRMEQQQQGNPAGACPAVATCTNAWLQPGGPFYVGGKFTYPVDMAKRFPWADLQVVGPSARRVHRKR